MKKVFTYNIQIVNLSIYFKPFMKPFNLYYFINLFEYYNMFQDQETRLHHNVYTF